MNSKLKAIVGAIVAASIFPGCTTRTDNSGEMRHLILKAESAERRASNRAGNDLVAYMSLDVMFPDSQLRTLARAAGKGRTTEVRSLVEQGANVNAQGNKGATALFWAMREGSVAGFRALLQLGADPNIVFEDGGTVMHWAVRNRNPAYLKLALEHGGDPNLVAGPFYKTPIFDALGERRDRLDVLLDAGADINAESRFGTPAYVAARRGSFDVVYELLEHGADYRIESSPGQDLMAIALGKRSVMDPNHELYQWLEKVIAWLDSRGH